MRICMNNSAAFKQCILPLIERCRCNVGFAGGTTDYAHFLCQEAVAYRYRQFDGAYLVEFTSVRLGASHFYRDGDSGLADRTKHIPCP